jgi:hypothetical protein
MPFQLGVPAARDDDPAVRHQTQLMNAIPANTPLSRAFALSLILALALLLSLLALPARTLAEGHRTACSARTAKHAKGRTGHPACATHKNKGAHHANSKRKPAKHAAKSHPKTKPAPPLLTPALCEDETAPTRATDGSFSCDDGSEPSCEGEATPIRSGHSLKCPVEPAETETETACEGNSPESFCYTSSVSSNEPACEDGSSPTPSGNGPSVCDDGSVPLCEDGSPASASFDGEPVCQDTLAEPNS